MSARIVASPVGEFDASGTGYVESQEYAAAAHTAITHVFRIQLSKSSDLFSAFSWADVNTEGNVDVSAGETDISGAALDQAQFAAVLAQVLRDASGGKLTANATIMTAHGSPAALGEQYSAIYALDSNAPRTARYVMKSEVRKEIEDMLDANDVLEYLEGDTLGNFQFDIDASGGAADMAAKLADNAALRNLILQFPNRPAEFSGETESSYNKLPVIAGDELTFVFNTTPEVTITETAEPASVIDASNAGVATAGDEDLDVAGLQVSTSTRKIAFIVEVIA
jgi:hypothetical protein